MKQKVLIIEDNWKNRMLEKDLLEIGGFEVVEAISDAAGILLARKEKPDAIVMDMRLSDMRGTQAAERMRQESETRDIPIIFVTASVIGEWMEEIRAIPKAMLLTKPVDTRNFAREISLCIRGGPHG